MCGIAGILLRNNTEKQLNSDIEVMTSALKHRGPDDEGYVLIDGNTVKSCYGDESSKTLFNSTKNHIKAETGNRFNVALGFRRLSIIDLSASGHQPMCYENRYWIVFNGEIYNYIELRVELEKKGKKFVSNSDTEVIMAAYNVWGKDCVNKFNGMWAFAIIDLIKNSVFVSRDRFGEKPLYYYYNDGNFIFASEAKALLKHPYVKTTPNLGYFETYIIKGFQANSKQTAFKDIYNFPVGSYMECPLNSIDPDNEIKKYWDLRAIVNQKNSVNENNDHSSTYFKLIQDSVKLRMRSDVKIGSTLSGGLDSATITYLINDLLSKENSSEKIETFSNVYSDPRSKDLDESYYIKLLTKTLNIKENYTEPKTDELKDELYKIVYQMDVPPSDSTISGWYVYKLISKSNVKVTLDGQGADEQLAGYLSYYYTYLFNTSVSHFFSEYDSFKNIPGINKKLLTKIGVLKFVSYFTGNRILKKLLRRFDLSFDPTINLNEQLINDIENNLQSLLHYGDRLSMAHSIESRSPFMDHRLVEFLASVPQEYKIHKGWSKYIARKAFEGKIPNEIVWRKDKMGYPNNNEYWFNSLHKEWMMDKINSNNFVKELLRSKTLSEQIKKDTTIEKNLRLLLICIWDETFFGKGK